MTAHGSRRQDRLERGEVELAQHALVDDARPA